jgi:hypothetical protein
MAGFNSVRSKKVIDTQWNGLTRWVTPAQNCLWLEQPTYLFETRRESLKEQVTVIVMEAQTCARFLAPPLFSLPLVFSFFFSYFSFHHVFQFKESDVFHVIVLFIALVYRCVHRSSHRDI